MTIINREFYSKNTLDVAKNLLGCVLCRNTDGVLKKGIIVEVEAYTQQDPACHAYKGKTKRSATLFKSPGLSYVYFIYGMYHCMNVVTEQEEIAGAVLIRALEPVQNVSNTNGPGKLCREMLINKDLNEKDLTSKNSPLWIESGDKIDPCQVVQTTRIGIKQAQDYPWRFYIKNNKWISKV